MDLGKMTAVYCKLSQTTALVTTAMLLVALEPTRKAPGTWYTDMGFENEHF